MAANSDWRVGSDHKLIYAESHGEVAEEEEEELRSGATWQGWKTPRGNADEVWAEMRELGEEDARAFIDEWIALTQDSEWNGDRQLLSQWEQYKANVHGALGAVLGRKKSRGKKCHGKYYDFSTRKYSN